MHNQAGFDKWKRNFLVTLHHAGLVQACESHYDATILPSDTFEIETSSLNGHKRAFAKRDLARGDEIITENVLVWSIEQLYWIRCDPEVQAWLASLRLPVMDQGMFDELYPPKTWLPRLLHILNSNATTDKDYKDEKLQNRWKKAWTSSEKRKHKVTGRSISLVCMHTHSSVHRIAEIDEPTFVQLHYIPMPIRSQPYCPLFSRRYLERGRRDCV